MKGVFFFFFFLSITLGTVACQTGAIEMKRITPKEALDLVSQDSNTQILDVRTPREWEGGVINKAQKLNFHDTNFAAQAEAKLNKDLPVVVYCAAGGRSPKAAQILIKLGFKQVFEVPQGYQALKDTGL